METPIAAILAEYIVRQTEQLQDDVASSLEGHRGGGGNFEPRVFLGTIED